MYFVDELEVLAGVLVLAENIGAVFQVGIFPEVG